MTDFCDDEIVEFDVPTDFGPLPRPLAEPDPEPVVVEVRRRAGLAALIGVLAAGVAALYLTRALDSGSGLAWAVFSLFGLVALAYLGVLVDARTPLLVADEQGLRLRTGRTWAGLTWGSLRRVDVVASHGLRDGRLVATPRNADRPTLGVPLSLSTRVTGTTDLLGSLRSLADDETEVGDGGPVEEVEHHLPDPRPTLAHGISLVAARLRNRPVDEPASEEVLHPEPVVVASATPSPLRSLVTGRRTEVTRELVQGANALKADLASTSSSAAGLPEAFELRRPDVDDWSVHEDVRPIAVPGEALETVVIEDFAIEPADDPVIGPEFAAARTRLGLTVDQLAERTRIRPHVIESVEADDFVPCGGDFYARGHIRTLARVLGVDAAPLLASYDERYADAPVNPRRVFEAELAHSGGIKATRGGPNWSVLVAAVMALVLAWSIARLVMDGPVDLRDDPVLNGSGGPNHGGAALAPAVPVVISAPGAGARVIVRDGGGSVVFSGDVAFGASKTLSVSPPVRVQASDGSVTVSVKGEDRGPLGTSGSPGSGTFVVR
ncbi:helix-turn-helix domain-containing protein [Nocardioides islandensis]|uniref:Helix-turn-helix domain-containing protein n=1 Tax=Nocardioides islandensis TaxID=433663 RepID=A0A930V9M0_9ACTN|nr:helix-turn-helix domain-containing protein [Nocardioides islandensis]MBF4763459.1 helix-turn-helix domain-containing protein [Nocardioides islandensis]